MRSQYGAIFILVFTLYPPRATPRPSFQCVGGLRIDACQRVRFWGSRTANADVGFVHGNEVSLGGGCLVQIEGNAYCLCGDLFLLWTSEPTVAVCTTDTGRKCTGLGARLATALTESNDSVTGVTALPI